MARTFEGELSARGLKVAVLVSRFNGFITDRLLDGALDALRRAGAADEDVDVVRVPGALELPLAASRVLARRRHDALVAVGAVIRGATTHYEHVCNESIKGLMQVQLQSGVPIGMGVITVNTIEQAIERAGTKAGNKGFDAAMTAIEMANLARRLGEGA